MKRYVLIAAVVAALVLTVCSLDRGNTRPADYFQRLTR